MEDFIGVPSENDSVESYFGMRKISIGKDDKGVTRIFLNNKPQYMIGPLWIKASGRTGFTRRRPTRP